MNHISLKKKKSPKSLCKVTHALAVQEMFWPIYMPDLIMHLHFYAHFGEIVIVRLHSIP